MLSSYTTQVSTFPYTRSSNTDPLFSRVHAEPTHISLLQSVGTTSKPRLNSLTYPSACITKCMQKQLQPVQSHPRGMRPLHLHALQRCYEPNHIHKYLLRYLFIYLQVAGPKRRHVGFPPAILLSYHHNSYYETVYTTIIMRVIRILGI